MCGSHAYTLPRYSGITKDILATGLPSAPLISFTQTRHEVAQLLAGNIIVGHALANDFAALKLKHPTTLKRDTAFFAPFTDATGKRVRQRKLRDIFYTHFQYEIQNSTAGHSSAEDASAALALYLKHKEPWEKEILSSNPTPNTLNVSARGLTLVLDGSNLPLGFKYVDGQFEVVQKRSVDDSKSAIHLRYEVRGKRSECARNALFMSELR